MMGAKTFIITRDSLDYFVQVLKSVYVCVKRKRKRVCVLCLRVLLRLPVYVY